MKILSTLLLALLLFLTGQPPCTAVEKAGSSCCTQEDCIDEEGAPAAENSEDGDCKGCNPFQSCSCCAAAVILPSVLPVYFSTITQVAVPVWGTYAPDCLLSWSGDFWQPPRLG